MTPADLEAVWQEYSDDDVSFIGINTRDQADTKNRITATVDANGNRTAVTLDAS